VSSPLSPCLPDQQPTQSPPPARWSELLAGRNVVRNLVLAGGTALHATNVFIVTTLLPSIVHDIGGLSLYAWNTTLFVVASVVGSASSAQLLRALQPRLAYVVSTAVFTFGALLCALAPSMPIMLLGRLIQGLGGGWLVALSYAMIRLLFRPALWPRAMAIVSAMWGIATLVGPAVGGWFAHVDAWRWGFGAVAPFGFIFALLASFILPRQGDEAIRLTQRLPRNQLALLTAAVLAISLGGLAKGVAGQAAGLIGGSALLGVLAWRERRKEGRLLPHGAFDLRQPLCLLYLMMGMLVCAVSPEIYVPYFLQELNGMTPLGAGYLTATMSAGWTLGSMVSSGFFERRIWIPIASGPLCQIVALVALAIIVPLLSETGVWLRWPTGAGLFLLGLGVGICWPHLLSQVLERAPKGEGNIAASSITTIELMAIAIGSSLAGLIVNAAGIDRTAAADGAHLAAIWLFALFALVPLLAVLAAVRLLRQR